MSNSILFLSYESESNPIMETSSFCKATHPFDNGYYYSGLGSYNGLNIDVVDVCVIRNFPTVLLFALA